MINDKCRLHVRTKFVFGFEFNFILIYYSLKYDIGIRYLIIILFDR